jgi:hypothetical protein
MFDHTTHDFGSIARGAKVEHRFIVENIYEEDAHITSVSSSCGCSIPTVNRQDLKTWEKAEVLVTVDTRAFSGRRDATIKVEFDKPFRAEVQINVHSYIRGDIVVQPGAVSFGSVLQGAEAKQTVAVNYAGRDDWRLQRVECVNPNVEVSFKEVNRGVGLVGYSLSARLKPNAPPGYIRDQLVLVTNDFDPQTARVPVAIEGVVVAPLSARPSPLMLGTVEPGESVTRNLLVQGRTPFRILTAKSTDPRFQCVTPADAKSAHVLPVTFKAGGSDTTTGGMIKGKLHIETNLTGTNAIDVDVSVQIVPVEKSDHP